MNDRGLSLLEVILSILILSIGLTGFFALFVTAVTGSAEPVLSDAALYLAQERMEQIAAGKRANGFATLTSANYPNDSPKGPDPVSGPLTFTRTVTFTDVAASDLKTPAVGSGYRKVMVTVSYGRGSVALVDLFTQ